MRSHYQTFTVRWGVCKSQGQPTGKRPVSGQQLGGEERAAQHPPPPWGAREGLRAEPPASPREAVPCLPPSPPSLAQCPLPPLGGHLGARCGAPSPGRVGAEGGSGRVAFGIKQLQILECGLCHLRELCDLGQTSEPL